MAPLGGVGELYLVSAGIGSIYLVISFLMGQMHTGGPAHGGGHMGAGAHGGGGGPAHGQVGGPSHGHVGGPTHGSIGGSGHGQIAGPAHGAAHGPAGHASPGAPHGTAGPAGHGTAGGTHGPTGTSHGPSHGQAGSDGLSGKGSGVPASTGGSASHLAHVHAEFHTGAHHSMGGTHGMDTGPVQALPRLASKLGRFVFTILSPMTLSIFLAFFGISGLAMATLVPHLALWTVIPAALIGLFVTRVILSLMAWAMQTMHVTSVVRVQEVIGLMGQVTVGILSGGNGQITYVANGMRCNARAQAIDPNRAFKCGERVMIADFQDQVAYVEPWTYDFPEDRDQSISLTEPIKELEQQDGSQGG